LEELKWKLCLLLESEKVIEEEVRKCQQLRSGQKVTAKNDSKSLQQAQDQQINPSNYQSSDVFSPSVPLLTSEHCRILLTTYL
jgi:hypothetical protein